MAKLMGMHNRITEKRYNAAKVELKSPKDDARVAATYGFGMTTARAIRNTDNYYEYRQRGTTGKNKREHLENTLADLQDEDDKTPISSILLYGVVILSLLSGIAALIYLIVRAG